MDNYKHILLAVDFFENDNIVSMRGKDLADRYQARLSIIHVIDNIPITVSGYDMDIPVDYDLTAELTANAKQKLLQLAKELNIDDTNSWLEIGSPKEEIIRVAIENKVDLIVVGSHGRHGLALLLGSTANSVLHHAQCDMLAVRLPDE